MKCFYETQVYGPQDQDFDVISIWRLYLPGVEPGILRWFVGITTNYAVNAFIRSDEHIHGVVGSYTDQSLWNLGFDSREI